MECPYCKEEVLEVFKNEDTGEYVFAHSLGITTDGELFSDACPPNPPKGEYRMLELSEWPR